MSAPSAPAEEGGDPAASSLSPSEASEGRTGLAGGVPPGLVLSGAERTQEALTAAAISLEYGRIVGAVDARLAAKYASRVVDNSRVLCGGNPRLHLNLLVSHRDWMRGLPTGSGELR
jgi:hypothetical protein